MSPAGPLPINDDFFSGGTGTFQVFASGALTLNTFGTCPDNAIEHGFLTDWMTKPITSKAQNDIGNFVMHDTLPPRMETPQ